MSTEGVSFPPSIIGLHVAPESHDLEVSRIVYTTLYPLALYVSAFIIPLTRSAIIVFLIQTSSLRCLMEYLRNLARYSFATMSRTSLAFIYYSHFTAPQGTAILGVDIQMTE